MTLTGTNQLWVADITHIRLHREFVFLAVIPEFSRKVVGWELDRTLAARLPIAALEKAIADRKPPSGPVHHSDRGIQYACGDYVEIFTEARHDSEQEPTVEPIRQRQLRKLHEDAQAGGNQCRRVSRP
jgi:transposase InsO family protein